MTIFKAEATQIEHLLLLAAKQWEMETLKWYKQGLDKEFGSPISEELCQRAIAWANTLHERRDVETQNKPQL